ncbi:MAG: amidohydrolase family protein [Bacilli bacterium]|nr:amidohydrolase family protein [Bacilli bacterium]
MTVYSGQILSVNANDDVFKYLVEDKGKIVFVGNELPEQYKNAKVVELGEKVLTPTFCDSHQHFASFSMFNAGLNVMDCESNEQMMEEIKKFVAKSKNKTLLAFGASPYSVKERVLLSREQLDKVCPKKPMMIVKYDGHACIVNSVLLKKLDKKLKPLRGYHPDTGEMNQEAFFVVSDYISNSISVFGLLKQMQQAADFQAKRGIGLIHTVSGVGFPMNLDITFEKIFGKSLQRGLQLRVFSQSLNPKVAKKRHLPRIGGCFECALDGCFGSQDASMNEPYINDKNNSGVLYYSDEKVTNFLKKANRMGLQIEMHAIGDKAFDQATRCMKAALDDFPREDHRHGIIHDCLPTEEGIKICKDYHIQMPVQTAFIGWKQEPDEYLEEILGKERANRLNPLRTFLNNNIMMSAGSDGPCTTPDPIDWIYKACNHSNPKESLTAKEALRICTYNGYWTTFDEKERGSLEVGKIADMVILSKNPYETPVKELNTIKVEQTFLGGVAYQNQKQSVLGMIFRGIFNHHKV